jgi:ubiquinone/menaquinone biosynthesis C-methylase UbiE
MLVPPQRDVPELLDLHAGSPRETLKSLRDIRRINTYLGGTRLSLPHCLSLMDDRSRPWTLLDVGSGLGDVGVALENAACEKGLCLRVVGADISRLHLECSRREYPQVLGVRADAFRLPLANESVDIVHSSLFLHHFRAPQIELLLREFCRVARVGWVMNDLVRHTLPLWFFRSTWPIFARSHLTRYDGSASVRRAYTVAEMRRIIQKVPGAQVHAHVPFRLAVTWKRPRQASS